MGINLPQDPAIPLLGIYPKDAQLYYKDICSNMFIAALFVISRNNIDAPQSKNGKRKCGIFTQRNTTEHVKNNDILKFSFKWMEVEEIDLSEVTQTQKDEHGIYTLIGGY